MPSSPVSLDVVPGFSTAPTCNKMSRRLLAVLNLAQNSREDARGTCHHRPWHTPRKNYRKRPGRILRNFSLKKMAGTIVSACTFTGRAHCQETNGCIRALSVPCGIAGKKDSSSRREARTESSSTRTVSPSAGVNTVSGKSFLASTKAATTRPSRPVAPLFVFGESPASSSIENIANAALPRLPCEPLLNQSEKREAASSKLIPSSTGKASAAPNCVAAATLRPSEICLRTELSPCSKSTVSRS